MRTNFTKIAVGLRSDSVHSGTLDAAVNLSKVFDCTVHLICFDDNCQVYEELIKEKAREGNIQFQFERRSNESAKEIIKATKELEADLLIVPADKSTQHIINELEIPVLSVKDDFKAKPVKHIVMPIHDKPETRQKIPVGAEIAKHFNAEVDLVVISGKSNEEQIRLKSYANQAQNWVLERGVNCTYDFKIGGKVAEETINYAIEKDADMIIIMNDRDLNFFSMQLSEKIVRNSPVPVMTVEPKDVAKGVARL